MADGLKPVTTDSRIKTLVYNENEVFTLVTNFGYQSNIEFGLAEEVDTISLGDQVGWQVIPGGRRLYVKALEENAHTNMTVVTNRHTYQFDLRSKKAGDGDEAQLSYVVRFFYPEDGWDAPAPAIPIDAVPVAAPVPVIPEAPAQAFNFNYTLTGPDGFAPLKVFDDGKATFFLFPNNLRSIPKIYALQEGRTEALLPSHPQGSYIVVDMVNPHYALKADNAVVCVFNETMKQQSGICP